MNKLLKNYRYCNDKKFLTDNYWLRFKIVKRFAFIPKKINNKYLWLSFYYSLDEIKVFHFGGRADIGYKTIDTSLTFFSFKNKLKKEGMIVNKIELNRKNQNDYESLSRIFKK